MGVSTIVIAVIVIATKIRMEQSVAIEFEMNAWN
jgi:hypothetical protein